MRRLWTAKPNANNAEIRWNKTQKPNPKFSVAINAATIGGRTSLPYSQFLGYERGEDGLPVIVEEQAVIVRQIYTMFPQGRSHLYHRQAFD